MWYMFKNPIYVTGDMADTYKSMGFEPKISFSVNPEIFYNPAITVLIIFMLVSMELIVGTGHHHNLDHYTQTVQY